MFSQSVAILLHVHNWALDEDVFVLDDAVSLCKTKDSDVERLYRSQCETEGIDDGDPYDFGAHILINYDNRSFLWGDPFALIERICNQIVLNTLSPMGFCRAIDSEDNFRTARYSLALFAYSQTIEFLAQSAPELDEETCLGIRKCWQVASALWGKSKSQDRVQTALVYFYHAWRSHYVDQALINLGIVLELLFSPHASGELSHQIAVNAARFMNSTRRDLKETYRFVKRFYSLRSALVHGAMPSDDKVIDVLRPAFYFCGGALALLLKDEALLEAFSDERSRADLLDSYVFGERA